MPKGIRKPAERVALASLMIGILGLFLFAIILIVDITPSNLLVHANSQDQLERTNIALVCASLIFLCGGIIGVWLVRRGLPSRHGESLHVDQARVEDAARRKTPLPIDNLNAGMEVLRLHAWKQARDSMSHRDVMTFLEGIRKLALQVDVTELTAYGERLNIAVTRFDIITMERELDYFPILVEQFHSLGSGA